jgi:acyl carrier protein
MTFEKEIKQILSKILDIEENQIDKESSADTIPGWDSLNQLKILQMLERNFGFMLMPQHYDNLRSYQGILDMLPHYLK